MNYEAKVQLFFDIRKLLSKKITFFLCFFAILFDYTIIFNYLCSKFFEHAKNKRKKHRKIRSIITA